MDVQVSAMRIHADMTLCEGHGQCGVIDMDLFPLDENGRSAIGAGQPVPPGEEEQAWAGVRACPVRALSIAP
ncbi:MAG TPA: ferredoxin [Pseudonocardia sp.]